MQSGVISEDQSIIDIDGRLLEGPELSPFEQEISEPEAPTRDTDSDFGR